MSFPERFYAASSYAGFDGDGSSSTVTSKLSNDVVLLLYALYQQATTGPCSLPKPRGQSTVEQSKWTSWHELGKMASKEAMRLFVKILEEEDPGWYSRASNFFEEPVVDVEMNHNPQVDPVNEVGTSSPETKTIPSENGTLLATQDKDIVVEADDSVGSIHVYDQWIAPSVSGQCLKSRYEHGAAIVKDKMYIFGGNHNGRYLNDLQVLDLRTWSWSKVEVKAATEMQGSSSAATLTPCAGHSLIPWEDKLYSIAGHTKGPSESLQVKTFDMQTLTWSNLKTYGKPPASRGGQSVTLVGTTLVIFGGQDAQRSLLNDLHLLDLETLTWDELEAIGTPPSPRSDHSAAVHAERYLLIFGGGSHATCFNDLHVLDMQTMEWSRPSQQGELPTPRAGHAGVTVGENWFIAGGGDNKNGVSETVVLNMSTFVWSVVTAVQGRVPLASEGLSLVVYSYYGENVLVSFGGYNGRYNNEVHVLKPSHKSTLQSKKIEAPLVDNVSATHTVESKEMGQEGKIKEIVMNNADSDPVINKSGEPRQSLLATLKAENQELDSLIGKEKLQALQLKQKLGEAQGRSADLYKELQSIRGQLAAEQSRCFKLEVGVAELRQKLQTMEALEKELELLQRQKAASEQAALNAKQQRQSSGGVWGWLAGNPPEKSDKA